MPDAENDVWRCPDCPWVHAAHPRYGWQRYDDGAVEAHRKRLCPSRPIPPGEEGSR